MTTGSSYDRVAARYAEEIGDELADKPLDRALLAALVELAGDGPLADLGAGPGHITAWLSTRRGPPTIAVDLSPAMCGLAHRAGVPAAAGDLTRLPLRDNALAGAACLYAVIHLDEDGRRAAYVELARVLRPGAHALVSFHTSDPDVPTGGARELATWWGEAVDLTFRFLDPAAEIEALAAAGLELAAHLDRRPGAGSGEHPSRRSYLLVRKR